MRKILIIKPSSLGDIIHGLQIAHSLKEQWEGTHLSWVVSDRFAPFVQACPTVDHVYVFNRKGGMKEFKRLVKELRTETFDAVLDFQGLARTGLMTMLTMAKRKIGRCDAREGAGFCYKEKAALPPAGHEAHALDILFKFLPRLGLSARLASPLTFNTPEPETIAAPLAEAHPVLMIPHSRGPEKEWGGFAELTKLVLEKHPDALVVWDSHQTAPDPEVSGNGRFLNLTGKTDLLQMTALVQRARVVVANDSGPMHLAAALGKPVVALFGPTPPERFGPYPLDAPHHYILRAPAGDLSKLEPQTVYEAVAKALHTT